MNKCNKVRYFCNCYPVSGTLFIPGGIPCVIEAVEALRLPAPVLFAGKTLIALPATYHALNGMRHLVRDCYYNR